MHLLKSYDCKISLTDDNISFTITCDIFYYHINNNLLFFRPSASIW